MSAAWLMVGASLLFAVMGVCVKLASERYGLGEIVFYRGLTGALMMGTLCRLRGGTLATRVPVMHLWRGIVGVTALSLWFYAIGGLPLGTAVTLNYMSSIWMAMFLIGGAIMLGRSRIDWRLFATVLVGFAGVALVLRPTVEREQLWHGLVGLLSGLVSAMAYLQLAALGRAGEPEFRTVFYFSVTGALGGIAISLWSGWHAHTAGGLLLLLSVGVTATAGQLMMTRAYATGRTLVNASLNYLGIAWAFAFGVLLFDDPITWMAMAGVLLIIGAGLSATQLRSRGGPADVQPSAES